MLFLFLDLEYTGFDLTKDQILEIGAAVCTLVDDRLKIISTFETLIKATIPIPDHIPRLTGLQESDFKNAPNLDQARKLWQTWIEKNLLHESEVLIVGHSVSNDIAFLKSDHFWLPQKNLENSSDVPALDTLDMVKILLPDQSNLNLEYLVKNLKLDQQVLQDINLFNSDANFLNLKPHRALFDTLTGIELFNYILNRLNLLNLPLGILEFLRQIEILPLKIGSLAQPISKFAIDQPEKEPENQTLVKMSFKGRVLESNLDTKIMLCVDRAQELLALVQNPELPILVRKSVVSIYLYLATTALFPTFQMRLHSYGLAERVSQEIGVDYILYQAKHNLDNSLKVDPRHPESGQDTVSDPVKTSSIMIFEKILSEIDTVTEDEFYFAKFSYLVDFFAECFEIEFDSKFEPKVSIEMDFLAARIEQVLQSSPKKEVRINRPGYNSDLDINDIFYQFQKICDKFKELLKTLDKIPKSQHFISYLSSKIDTELQLFFAQKWENSAFIVRLSKNILKFTKAVPNFEWSNYWYKMSQIENLELTTYLDQNGWQMLGVMVAMPDELYTLPNDFVKCLRQSPIEIVQNDQETLALLQSTQAALKPDSVGLVLCGQNSGLEKVVDLMVNNFKSDQFLAMGETGSLAKIVGKIRIGFRGLVILKANDLFMLKQIHDLALDSTTLIIQPPHINLNQFWFKNGGDPKDTIRTSKRIALNSTVGQLSLLGVTQVIYQPEIVN